MSERVGCRGYCRVGYGNRRGTGCIHSGNACYGVPQCGHLKGVCSASKESLRHKPKNLSKTYYNNLPHQIISYIQFASVPAFPILQPETSALFCIVKTHSCRQHNRQSIDIFSFAMPDHRRPMRCTPNMAIPVAYIGFLPKNTSLRPCRYFCTFKYSHYITKKCHGG